MHGAGLHTSPAPLVSNSGNQWKEIITWFILEQSSQNIILRTSLERWRVLQTPTITRRALTSEVRSYLLRNVEVDETYLGGKWKNKQKTLGEAGIKKCGKGTKR